MGPYEYIEVRKAPQDPRRRTPTYVVTNKHSGADLGTIQWYGPWRQFCFFPLAVTVWSNGCLDDVKDAISKAMDESRRVKKGLAPLDVVDDRKCCGSCETWDNKNRTDGVGLCCGEIAHEGDGCRFHKPKRTRG